MSGSFVQALLMDDPEANPPPVATCVPDPYYNGTTQKTVLLLHMDAANGSGANLVDSSSTPKAMAGLTPGAAVYSASAKFGLSGLLLNGTTEYTSASAVETDFDFGAGDFTVETWVKPSSVSRLQAVVNTRPVSIDRGWGLYISGAGKVTFTAWNTSGASIVNFLGTTTMVADVYQHIAITRSGSSWRLFLDGGLEATATSSATIGTSTQPLVIGRDLAAAGRFFGGSLDEMRITKGVARYTATFTPQTLAFCDGTIDPSGPTVSGSELLSGLAATTAQGTITVANPWVKLTGSAVTASVGSGGVSVFNPNRSVALTGQALTASRGSVASPPYPELIDNTFPRKIYDSGIFEQVEIAYLSNGNVTLTATTSAGSTTETLGTWIDNTQTAYTISSIAALYRPIFSALVNTNSPYASVALGTNMSSSGTVTLFSFALPNRMQHAFQITALPTTTNPRYGEVGYSSTSRFIVEFF